MLDTKITNIIIVLSILIGINFIIDLIKDSKVTRASKLEATTVCGTVSHLYRRDGRYPKSLYLSNPNTLDSPSKFTFDSIPCWVSTSQLVCLKYVNSEDYFKPFIVDINIEMEKQPDPIRIKKSIDLRCETNTF